jgi:hypothetical protein
MEFQSLETIVKELFVNPITNMAHFNDVWDTFNSNIVSEPYEYREASILHLRKLMSQKSCDLTDAQNYIEFIEKLSLYIDDEIEAGDFEFESPDIRSIANR